MYTQIATASATDDVATVTLADRDPQVRILRITASFDSGSHDPAEVSITSDDSSWNDGNPLVLGVCAGGGMPYEFDLGEGFGVPGTPSINLAAGNAVGYLAVAWK